MGDINKMIQWMKDREGKTTYSQSNRMGPNSYDCSSAVYFALAAGGFIPSGSMGWTGSLHDTTLPSIATKIARSECTKGDIFLSKYWANDGHTGIFVDNKTIIHCSYGRNGIYTTPADGGYMGYEPIEYYRLKNANSGSEENTEKEGEIMMYIYWKQQKINSSTYDAYLLNGNKRMYIKDNTLLNECRALVRLYGDNTKEERFYNDAFRVLALEATTDLVEFKYYANK
ncbi:peptidoglycan amidohydrolase family protein [Enterococcus sp. AZ196]|uniref:peptidoglycan amidohydrolase family protein n=1 Tax=Enterococcus sp. AZ196 TaxID=2774659 RepID=UPI003D265B48